MKLTPVHSAEAATMAVLDAVIASVNFQPGVPDSLNPVEQTL